MEAQTPDDLIVRALTIADAPQIRALFQEVFKKEMTEAHWTWKYQRALSRMTGVFRDGRLVAHYGGLGNVISLNGKFVNALQIVDVMVSPSVRQGVRNRSPFFLAASHFIDEFAGLGKLFWTGYGFPNDRHLVLAARMKLYAPVGRMWELNWELATQPVMPWSQRTLAIDASNFAQHRRQLERLWARQLHDLQQRVVVRKDADFIEWRYLRHPVERYELLLVVRRFIGTPLGLCVLKVEAERVQLMDVIAPLARVPQLVNVARAFTWQRERRKLYTWCSEPDTGRFGEVMSAQALDITIPANIWGSGPALEELRDRWWLMPGDTDFL